LINPDPNSRAFFDLGIPINVFKVDRIVKDSQQFSSRGNDNDVPWTLVIFLIVGFGSVMLSLDYAIAYYNRGVAKSNLGRNEAAILDYNKAIELNPNHANAYYNRGLAKSALGDKTGAKKDYEKAVKLYQKDGNQIWENKAINAMKNLGI
jgi:tetratricopeptide (TPR) repeat protein